MGNTDWTDDWQMTANYSFLARGGDMGARIRAFDWTTTPLGEPGEWPQALRTVVRLMLNTGHPMCVFWGPAATWLYNDAYCRSIGPERHPGSLGQPGQLVWAEIWDVIGPQIAQVMAGGNATWQENQLLPITRNGQREDVYWTYSYSPIDDEAVANGVGGVLVVCTETTQEVSSTRRAVEQREQFAALFEQAPTFMAMLVGPDHVVEFANPGYLRLIGGRDIIGRTVAQGLPDAAEQGYVDLLDTVYRSGQPYVANSALYAVQATPDDPVSERYVDFVFQPIRTAEGEVRGIFVEGVDVTDRKLAEARRAALARFTDEIRDLDAADDITYAAARLLGETLGVSRVGYGTIDPVAETLEVERDWNAAGVQTLAGTLHLRDFGSFIEDLKLGNFIAIGDVAADPRTSMAAAPLIERSAAAFVNVPVLEHGRLVAVLYVNHAETRAWCADDLALIREIAARARSASERVNSAHALQRSEARLREVNESLEAKILARTRALMSAEEALRHAQKMEAVGQLTGGLAHDFNNLLAGIQGSLDLMRLKLAQGRAVDIERYIEVALGAVNRAAALTHRLLAFSRRQTLDPKPTDVNRLVGGMEDLIRRTIGPSVALEVVAADGLWPTFVDAPQLENSLLNLCLNARDAMPGGGRLAIETANVRLDDAWAAQRGLAPGRYVALSVTDSGTGMTPDVIARAFDPFFTTKPLGQGTGLGLSMVYGFAQQSGGQIRIHSAAGAGTTMSIYLPQHDHAGVAADDAAGAVPAQAAGSGEIILVVDDEPSIRMLLAEVLNDAGYGTVEAADGPSALRILQSGAKIDLLITDVGLPGGINGRQLADAGRVGRPALKVLFITGYAQNAAVGNGQLGPGMQLMTKPFAMDALASRVREIIQA
jgi:signal transduction histidine kinase/CheY-like chemotaxis protein/PAS domain-containing protein